MFDGTHLSDPRDYVLDFTSKTAPAAPTATATEAASDVRPYLCILFKCCNAYARIYKTSDSRAYAGHCPRCARAVRVPIGPHGTGERLFIAE
jgi:hypothetical protein